MNAAPAPMPALDRDDPEVRTLLSAYDRMFAEMPPELHQFRPDLERFVCFVSLAVRDMSQTVPPDVYAGPLLGIALTAFAQAWPKLMPGDVARMVWEMYANILTGLGRRPPDAPAPSPLQAYAAEAPPGPRQ